MEINQKDERSTTQAAALQTSSPQLDITENFPVSPATLKTSEEIIADLTGVTNVLMPVSTLSFLFQRFDMLEKQLDDLKSRDIRDFAPPTVSAALAQTISTNNGELVARILTLEEVIADQNKIFIEMSNTCKLLVEDNTVPKETLIGFQHTVKNNKAAESNEKPRIKFNRSIDLFDGSQCTLRNEVDCADYSHKIIVTNIFESSNKHNLDVVDAVLSTILPTIGRDDIISTRSLGSNRKNPVGSSEIKPVKRRCPWIVKLRDHKLVKELM